MDKFKPASDAPGPDNWVEIVSGFWECLRRDVFGVLEGVI